MTHNTTKVTNYHVLIVKYIGPGAVKPSRVKIISERFKKSITIPYDHECGNALAVAETFLLMKGYNIVGHGEGKGHMYVITNTFKSL